MSDFMAALLRSARCGACGGHLARSRLNLVQVERKPSWEYPTSANLLTHYGPCANALLCDRCVESPGCEVKEVVELGVGGQVIYHAVESLEALGPEPTHVLRDGGIVCLVCGKTSFNRNDVSNLYCGFCKAFHPIGR